MREGHRHHVIVAGRMPPPLDGQSIATQRFARMMEGEYEVHPVRTSIEAEASFLRKWQHYRHAGKELERMLDRHPEAVVVWHSISPQISGHLRDVLTLKPIFKGRKVIAVVHWGSFAKVFHRFLTRPSAVRLMQGLTRIVFTQEDRLEACRPWLRPDQGVAIPNTLDADFPLSEAALERKHARSRRERFTVLFLSNMFEEKGFRDVAGAAELLARDHPEAPFHFVFAGAWPSAQDEDQFRKDVAALGDRVTVLGAVRDRERVRSLHEEADAFILPSRLGESQPLSIIEALSHGTPVILADHGGMPAMIQGTGAGSLVPPRSPKKIADALGALLDEESWLGRSRSARTTFEERYAPAYVARRWNDLISQVREEVA